jgi:hypothetical protein
LATVIYSTSLPYMAVEGMHGLQPAAEVELSNGDRRIRTVGIFDSGSVLTVFSNYIATLLGIDDVTTGTRQEITTFGGNLDVYMFDLEIEVLATATKVPAQIGFLAGHAPRNILGRGVIFSALQIGFHDSASIIHLRPD